ncbi:MAG: hypothetical protein AB1486_13265 [Planctomycetota bacterium]
MFQQFFAESGLLFLPIAAMLFFLAVFLVVLGRLLFGMRNQEHLRRMASLPLEDDGTPPAQVS